MFDQPVVLPALAPISLAEILIVFTIASMAYFLVFNNFEKVMKRTRVTDNQTP